MNLGTSLRPVALDFIALLALALANPAQAHGDQILYTFTGGADGANPTAGLVSDAAGNLYGTALFGGTAHVCGPNEAAGCGTVFRLSPDGTETTLHAFQGGADGGWPQGRLLIDARGNLYGVTNIGGNVAGSDPVGLGKVFEITPDGREVTVYVFENSAYGELPEGGLQIDSAGNLYGVTRYGGSSKWGTVFKITPAGAETTLYNFNRKEDGVGPGQNGLLVDQAGNVYGTTPAGGLVSGNCSAGCGTIFEISPIGTKRTLYRFTGGLDGSKPSGGLILDAAGNLYGTTASGGVKGRGVIFRLAKDRKVTVLHSFLGGADGCYPTGGVTSDDSGNLYGVTEPCSGSVGGTVFVLSPNGIKTTLHTFRGGADGSNPNGGLMFGPGGYLYGTTSQGGVDGAGTVFRLSD